MNMTANQKVVRAVNRVGAKIGDPVSIVYGMSSLKTAALVYLFPLILMIAGAGLGSAWNAWLGVTEETATVIFGFAGLALGFGILMLISRAIGHSKRVVPVINRILTQNPAQAHDVCH